MKPVILVVDMLKDAFKAKDPSLIAEYLNIVPLIGDLLKEARARKIPVIFACDSFLENDFIFQGRRGFCIRGTEGAEVIDELRPEAADLVLPKRRFSAFFKTYLDQDLRMVGVDTVVITGINTEGCVYSTALDAVAHDFHTIVLTDCSASRNRRIHEQCISALSHIPLFPLLRVMTSREFLDEAEEHFLEHKSDKIDS